MNPEYSEMQYAMRLGRVMKVVRTSIVRALVSIGTLLCACSQLAADGRPADFQKPLQTEFVYDAVVEIGAAVDVGETATGHRRYIPITGGSFHGEKLNGVVLSGGADWQTERPDGVTEVDALYSMKCDDGTVIIVHNSGVISGGGKYLRTTPRFEVAQGPYAWLTQSNFLGSISAGPRPGTVTIHIFRVL